MTGAPDLQHVADLMRQQHGPDHERHAMWEAIAEWLEYVAMQGDRAAINHRARANAVARAYLDATP